MFTSDDTKAVKGVAILLMFLHHLAAFPDRFPVGFDGFSSVLWKGFAEDGYLQRLAGSSKICVSIFFFLGGYGLYKQWAAGKFDLAESVAALYKRFWKVYLVFVPVAFLFFARSGENINSLATRYLIDSKQALVTTLVSNFLGFSSSLNSEWWFFSSYLCTLLLGYLFLRAVENHRDLPKDLFLVAVISIFITGVAPNLPKTEAFANINTNIFYSRLFMVTSYAGCFFEGVVFAKYDALEAMKKRVGGLPLEKPVCLLGIAVVFWCRMYIDGSVPADILYVPFFIAFLSDLFDGFSFAKGAFSFIGKHSAAMWYVHSFYCYYFLEVTKIVYCTNNIWIDLLVLTAISLATAVLLEWIYRQLGNLRKIPYIPDKSDKK